MALSTGEVSVATWILLNVSNRKAFGDAVLEQKTFNNSSRNGRESISL